MSTRTDSENAMNNKFQKLVDQIKATETFEKEVARDLVSDQIDWMMKKHNVKKAELARRLGKSRAYITKILQGNANFTLDTLVQIARALGYRFEPAFVPQEIEWQPSAEVHLTAKARGTTCTTTVDSADYAAPIGDERDADESNTGPLIG